MVRIIKSLSPDNEMAIKSFNTLYNEYLLLKSYSKGCFIMIMVSKLFS